MKCPECGVELEHKVWWDEEGNSDEGVVCPNGCNLGGYYA